MKKIAIVDDAEFMRKFITKFLREINVEIVGEASTADEGVSLYKTTHPDLITMDITMPNKSGLEAIKEIIDYDPNATILVISSIGNDLIIMQALELGAKNFVVKPFKKEKLIKTVKSLLDL